MKTQTEQDHAAMVKRLKKPGIDITAWMTPTKADLLHMANGTLLEAAELLDPIHKHAFYNKPLDLENIIEELGDLEFYMQGLRQILQLDREEILKRNIAKLTMRYGDKYSDQKAQERRDKQ